MLERQIERKLTESVKKCGGICLKQNGMAGIADRLVLMPMGRMAFVELKAPGKKMRPLQMRRKRQLERLGFSVYCIDCKEQIGDVIAEIGGGTHEVHAT